MRMSVVPALERWRQKDQEFRSCLSCIASSGTAWDTGYPDSHKPNKIEKPEKGFICCSGLPSKLLYSRREEQENEMSLSN